MRKTLLIVLALFLATALISACAHGTKETKQEEAAIPITKENLAQLKGIWTGEITAVGLGGGRTGTRSSTLEIHNDTLPLKGKFIHHQEGSISAIELEFDGGTIKDGILIIAWGGSKPAKTRMSLYGSQESSILKGEYEAASISGGTGAGRLYYQKKK